MEASSGPTYYVKGYGVDRAKIMRFLNTEDSQDGRIDRVVFKILDYVDKGEHPICGGQTLDDRINMNVIAFGNEAFGDNPDELKKKELTPPKYLEKATGLLRGPEVFGFIAW
ncbi:hypothetical protein NLJ89_g3419 [Agrocybe chaxingu]|uniref:Uncharacterized protein n=1 Tax=Agrocybe chaxingu TaxID=84603 RepID=A0A9W8MXC9_9AGAR|nr:hypothetical protein NLJ89_g3419 [Agrocybe chaxingu]